MSDKPEQTSTWRPILGAVIGFVLGIYLVAYFGTSNIIGPFPDGSIARLFPHSRMTRVYELMLFLESKIRGLEVKLMTYRSATRFVR